MSDSLPSAMVPPAGPGIASGGTPLLPVGQKQGWVLAFSDEFDGTALDMSRWIDVSTAEPDEGRGNPGNQQLEWNQAANCQVADGELAMTARREAVTSPSGHRYDWTSCLLSSAPSYQFQYGYLEQRSVLPAPRGFWPAFWTWQASDVEWHTETDVYEFYSDNRRRLSATQHSGTHGSCIWQLSFDATTAWHIYGVAIEPSGTTWYVDGTQVFHTDATADAVTNIIANMAVYSEIPPEVGTTTATMRLDYIRAWSSS